MTKSRDAGCDRPGCYEPRRPRSKFCSEECRRALANVERRERRRREKSPSPPSPASMEPSVRAVPDPEVVLPEPPPPEDADAFVGTWRITDMELWDQEAIDLLGPGFFSFAASDRFGHFRFIAVEGDLDCRYDHSSREPRVEFSWFGVNDNDQGSGRGWAVVRGDLLEGRFYFHRGDDSAFTARRQQLGPDVTRPQAPPPRRRRGRW